VLGNWSVAKGGPLVAAALRARPALKCLWIGDPPRRTAGYPQITFAGRLGQPDAFAHLKKCRVLLMPYLPVRSLKWNYALKIFEYLQLGRPVLASDNPGNAAVASRFPGRVALFRSGDVADLAASVENMV
jgi:glycosyltransferase involved in cell wall biosynthesis